jgi:hypothetical protein
MAIVRIGVSEDFVASILKVLKIGEVEATLLRSLLRLLTLLLARLFFST